MILLTDLESQPRNTTEFTLLIVLDRSREGKIVTGNC